MLRALSPIAKDSFRVRCSNWFRAVIVPSKGENDYAAAELKNFIYECGRTFGILQYDQESPLRNLCQRVCAELGVCFVDSDWAGRNKDS